MGKVGRPRIKRWCEWCGDELAYSPRKHTLCKKEECKKEWWADHYERMRERRRQLGTVKICQACGKEIWGNNLIYCNGACRKAGIDKRVAKMKAKLKRLSYLPIPRIADRLDMSYYAVRNRMRAYGIEYLRKQATPEESKRTKEQVARLTKVGVSRGQAAERLGVTRGVVAGHAHRARKAEVRACQ